MFTQLHCFFTLSLELRIGQPYIWFVCLVKYSVQSITRDLLGAATRAHVRGLRGAAERCRGHPEVTHTCIASSECSCSASETRQRYTRMERQMWHRLLCLPSARTRTVMHQDQPQQPCSSTWPRPSRCLHDSPAASVTASQLSGRPQNTPTHRHASSAGHGATHQPVAAAQPGERAHAGARSHAHVHVYLCVYERAPAGGACADVCSHSAALLGCRESS